MGKSARLKLILAASSVLAICGVSFTSILALYVLYVVDATDVVGSVRSADGRREAILIVINSGAMDSYVTAVAVASTRVPLGRQFAVLNRSRDFVVDDNDGAVSLGKKHQLNVTLRWISNSDLEITFPEKANIRNQKFRDGSVALQYSPK